MYMLRYRYLDARGKLLQRDEPPCGRPTRTRSTSWGGSIVRLGVSPTNMSEKGEFDVAIGSFLGDCLSQELYRLSGALILPPPRRHSNVTSECGSSGAE